MHCIFKAIVSNIDKPKSQNIALTVDTRVMQLNFNTNERSLMIML